ncbi:MAG: hypothetical protein ACRDIU_09425, partial [Actinomycetota bacterium]
VPVAYEDSPSRKGGRMNMAAYDAVRRDTAGILNGFAWLTRSYLEKFSERDGSTRALYDISYVGITLPQVLFHRAKSPIPPQGRLPSFIAAIFKASRGVFYVSVDLMNHFGETHKMSAEELVAYAETNGNLIRSETGRACAAPTRLIQRTLAVMLSGEGGDPTKSTLEEFVDFEKLWHFHTLQDRFAEALNEYGYFLKDLVGGAEADSPGAMLEAVSLHGGMALFAARSEEMLERANASQSALNRALGRSDDAATVRLDDLLSML